MIEITSVWVRLLKNKGTLKAIVTIIINDCIAIHDLKVIEANGNTFVMMPSRKFEDGHQDICHPINSETRKLIETAVLDEYNNVLKKS